MNHYIFITDHKEHSGYFADEFDTELEVFCPWIGGDLQVFDVNHDGYDDLICHISTGIIQISENHIVQQLNGIASGVAEFANQTEGGLSENGETGTHVLVFFITALLWWIHHYL